jgi:hypothetical protein
MEMEPEWEEEINRWYDEEHLPEIMAVPGFISARRFLRVNGPTTSKPSKYLCIYEIANENVVLDRAYLEFHTGWKGATTLGTTWTKRVSTHYRSQRSLRRQVFPVRGVYTDSSGESGKAPVPVVGSSLEDAWTQPIGSAILHVLTTVDPDCEQELLDWYDNEQTPALMICPGFLSARRLLIRYDDDRGDASILGHHTHLSVYQLANEGALQTGEYAKARGTLEASRKRIAGMVAENASLYRQAFPESGAYNNHSGPAKAG